MFPNWVFLEKIKLSGQLFSWCKYYIE